MNILFLSTWFPYPPNNGSKLRISNLLEGLASKHEITLLSFVDKHDQAIDTTTARTVCRDIQVVPLQSYNPQNWRARLGFLNLTPRSIVDTFSPQMAQRIRQVLAAKKYDVIIASQLGTAVYAPFFNGVPAVFEELEVATLYEQFVNAKSIRHRIRHGLTWAKHRRYVSNLLRHFRACTVVSEQERQLLQRCVPEYRAIEVIPNCICLSNYVDVHAQVQPNSLIFTGSFRFYANYDAAIWFLREVYPRVQSQIPEVRLTITGDHANLPLPSAEKVNLTGFIDDVRPLIASAWTSLAPIRQGGGTRLKILEAMILRTPVIATAKGAEGLDVKHDEHLLIADSPVDFSYQIVRLLREPQLRQWLADNAYQFVREKYNCANVMPRFMNLVERIIPG